MSLSLEIACAERVRISRKFIAVLIYIVFRITFNKPHSGPEQLIYSSSVAKATDIQQLNFMCS